MKFRKANATVLANDLSQILNDLRDVLTSTKRSANPAAFLLFNKAATTLDKFRATSTNVLDQSKAMAHNADVYAHESPWKAAGGALAVGALLGFALSRH